MIGLRTGLKVGLRSGVAVGLSKDRLRGGASGITRDATSGIYLPSSSSEWTLFNSANALTTAAPSSLWLDQETAGNVLDQIGALPLTKTNAPTYQQAFPGYSRLAVAMADNSSGCFVAGSGAGPNPATTSQLWYGLLYVPATPAGLRILWGINTGNTSTEACRVTHASSTGKLNLQVVGNTAVSVNSHSGGVHPIVVKYDRTNAAAVLYTDLEKLVGTYSASVIDGNKGFGHIASTDAAEMAWGAMWQGAAAEAFTDAKVKALLQAQGFAIPWS